MTLTPAAWRKLTQVLAPAAAAAYISFVIWDRSAYHVERRKELDAARAEAKAEAARRVAADP